MRRSLLIENLKFLEKSMGFIDAVEIQWPVIYKVLTLERFTKGVTYNEFLRVR